MKRVLTALALIPIVVYVVLFAPEWLFLVILAAAAILSYREFDDIAAAYGSGRPGWMGYAVGLVLLIPQRPSLAEPWRWQAWLPFALLSLLAIVLWLRGENTRNLPRRAALLVIGVLYIFGCWRCAIPLREANPHWLMFALLVNWAGDSGAYYIGKNFGKHKLAPRVSPKKTWEGAAASVVAAVLVAGGYLMFFIPELPWWHAVAVSILANVAGQLGDLAESAMKRGAGVKDSGTLLPGHGGFLDRVDSTLFALPVVYAYVTYLRVAG